jgi:hypothetical protein
MGILNFPGTTPSSLGRLSIVSEELGVEIVAETRVIRPRKTRPRKTREYFMVYPRRNVDEC